LPAALAVTILAVRREGMQEQESRQPVRQTSSFSQYALGEITAIWGKKKAPTKARVF